MEKYISLLNPNKIKADFKKELVATLAGVTVNQIEFRERFEGNFLEVCKHPTINLNTVQLALIDKVDNMLNKGGGLKDVVIMLNSFSRGIKPLKSDRNEYTHEAQYSYKTTDGNEKLSHSGNLPKGHFRWNFGERYTLTTGDLEKISTFIQPLVKHLGSL